MSSYIEFTITDRTTNVQSSQTFVLNVSTSRNATCTYEDIFGSASGVALTANGAGTSHTKSITAVITGYNAYRVTCTDVEYEFIKSEDVLVRVIGIYAIDIPGNGIGFTTLTPAFFLSKKQLQETSLDDYNLTTVLNATAGPTAERLALGNVDDLVWIWDAGATSWDSYDVSEEDFDMNTTTLAYYLVELKSSGAGKSIRHD
jgi:hypothetical protein